MSKKSTRDVIDRIKDVFGIENRKGSDTRLCEVLDVSRQTLASWLSRDSVPYAICIEIAENKGLTLDWLLTGEGPMLKGGVKEAVEEQALTPRQQAVLGLFNALPDEKQREILSALEDKKRMIDMEAEFKELKSVLAALKSAG